MIVLFCTAEATRNWNELTRNPRGIVGRQKRYYIGDIDGLAHPAQGRLRNRERLHLRRSGPLRRDLPFRWRRGVSRYQNIPGAKLRRQALRDRVDCRLTGDLDIPAPALNAYFISGLEFAGGIFLILGLGSRPIALPLAIHMTVAYITADREALFSILSDPDKFTGTAPYTFLVASLIVLIFGPGKLPWTPSSLQR